MSERRRVLLDVSPLRESRQYRLLYSGQLVSFMGHQLTVVAVPYQVYQLTHSSLQVGLVSLVQLGPLIACSFFGGALADAVDRRKLLLATQMLLATVSTGLALNARGDDPAVWPIYLLTAAAAGLAAVDSPTRSAAVPTLVRRDQLPAALALGQTLIQTGQVIGPSVAGLVIARVSISAAYWVDVVTYGVAALALLRMRPMVPHGGGTRVSLSSVAEGLRLLRSNRPIQGTFVIDLNAMVFGMPRALFPAMGTEVFGGGAATVGLLYAAPGAGALVGALTTGWVSGVQRQGRAVLVAVIAWGAAIMGFGITTWLPLALLCLALAGAADVVSAIFRNTILQLSVPDRLRGRLSAIHIAVVTGGPRLGDLEAGAMAALTTARFSVISGGAACIAGVAVIARLIPELGTWTMRDAVVEEEDAPEEPGPG